VPEKLFQRLRLNSRKRPDLAGGRTEAILAFADVKLPEESPQMRKMIQGVSVDLLPGGL